MRRLTTAKTFLSVVILTWRYCEETDNTMSTKYSTQTQIKMDNPLEKMTDGRIPKRSAGNEHERH
jgi:hypothetical protein